MEDRFIIPVVAMLTGLGVWLVYVIARAVSTSVRSLPPQTEVGVCLVAGGLIVFSGVR